MSHYFLLNEAVRQNDYLSFERDMLELLDIVSLKNKEDKLLKHNSFWELSMVQRLYCIKSQNNVVLLKFLEQIENEQEYISCSQIFDDRFPNSLNAFLGIDFSNTSIEQERQVKDKNTFLSTRRCYYLHFPCKGDKEKMRDCLRNVYGEKYIFSDQAIDDMTYWNKENPDLYAKTNDRLADIQKYPTEGGLGQTEKLKGRPEYSKRINHEHRIVYRMERDTYYIDTCKGHYTN
jgi:toxin YoeB